MNELLHISPISDVIGWGVFDHRICSISRPPYLNILDVHHYLNWSPAFVPECSSQVHHSSCFWNPHILPFEEPVECGVTQLVLPCHSCKENVKNLGEIDNEREKEKKEKSIFISLSFEYAFSLPFYILQLIFLLDPSILLFRCVTYSGSQNLNTKA